MHLDIADKKADLDNVFTATNYKAEKNPNDPVNALMRCAGQIFVYTGCARALRQSRVPIWRSLLCYLLTEPHLQPVWCFVSFQHYGLAH
jgi:hypothetical protein